MNTVGVVTTTSKMSDQMLLENKKYQKWVQLDIFIKNAAKYSLGGKINFNI